MGGADEGRGKGLGARHTSVGRPAGTRSGNFIRCDGGGTFMSGPPVCWWGGGGGLAQGLGGWIC